MIKIMILSNSENTSTVAINIPHYNTWIVTMWHFGADSRLQCTGEKFSITFQRGKRCSFTCIHKAKRTQGYKNTYRKTRISKKINYRCNK